MDGKKFTIDDVARELELSKTTVSRAISGKGRVGMATRDRVLAYIDKIGYRPSNIARGLANSRTYNIAFVMPGDSRSSEMPFFQKCLWGISNLAAHYDYDVMVAIIIDGNISQMERLVKNNKIDGVILGRNYLNDPAEKYLRNMKVPFVIIGSSSKDGVIQVDNNHTEACCKLTERILEKGYSKVALIGGDMRTVVNQQRLNGFKNAFENRNISIDEKLNYLDLNTGNEIESAVDDIIKNKADCIVCMDDSICAQVVTKLEKEGIVFPKEIGLASFYDSSLLEHIKPGVTAISYDVQELGEKACHILIDTIEEQNEQVRTLLGYSLLIKNSI